MARRRFSGFVMVVLVTAALLGAALFFVAPWYAKKTAIETAAREGVRLTVEHASLGIDGVHLTGVTASVPETPGSLATIADLTIAFSGFTPTTATLQGVEVTLEGDAQALMLGLASARRIGEPSGAGGTLRKVVVQNAHIRWNGAFGPSTSLDATDVSADLLPSPRLGDELHATGTVRVAAARELGPWTVTMDRSPTLVRNSFDLDPAEKGAATVVLTRTIAASKAEATTLDADIRKRKLSKLGIPGALFLLPAKDDPEIELHVKHVSPASDRSEGAVLLDVRGLQLPQMTMPGDLSLDLGWAGDPRAGIALSRGALTLGPFDGEVHGTVQPIDGGVRANLAFKSKAVPCAVLAGAQLGGVSAPLAALAQASGLSRAVTGDADISAVFVFDSSKTSATRFEVTPSSRCGVALFPANEEKAR